MEKWPTYYLGRKWDAPMTDDAVLMPAELVEALLPQSCFCGEPMTPDDNLLWTPGIQAHLECYIRSGMGDVQHLEGRCSCGSRQEQTLKSDHYETYRDSARAAIEWLVKNNRGRFHDE